MKTFEKSDLFGELESTLESAIELCSKYAGKHWLMKAFQGSADESKFDGIVKRLDTALVDAQFGLQADGELLKAYRFHQKLRAQIMEKEYNIN